MVLLPPFGKRWPSFYSRRLRAWNHRLSRILAVEERNLLWQEMERDRREWREKVEAAARNGLPLPVGGGLIPAKFEIASGLRGLKSGWDIDTVPVADFSYLTLAAAGSARTIVSTYPTFNPVHGATAWMDVPDLEPFEEPGGTLAGTTGSRVAGSSQNPLAILGAVYWVHITAAAAVYQPAGTTGNARVISTVGAVGAGFQTLSTLNLATAANFVDIPPIASPAERQVAVSGGPYVIGTILATVAAVFNGDSHFAELVTTGALTVVGNILAMEAEII